MHSYEISASHAVHDAVGMPISDGPSRAMTMATTCSPLHADSPGSRRASNGSASVPASSAPSSSHFSHSDLPHPTPTPSVHATVPLSALCKAQETKLRVFWSLERHGRLHVCGPTRCPVESVDCRRSKSGVPPLLRAAPHPHSTRAPLAILKAPRPLQRAARRRRG